MDSCCPNPERPAIIPDTESLKHRRLLRYVIYGELYACFAKFVLLSPISGILQLFSVWIAYSSWAQMFYCSLIF